MTTAEATDTACSECDEDMCVVEEPPRNTSKHKLPDACVLKRSTYNRSCLYVPGAQQYDELRCSSSITQYVDRTSRFHSLHKLNARTASDYAHTTLHCWHDTQPFDGPVIPAPKSFDSKERTFTVFGAFCSLSCAKAFLLESPTYETSASLVLLERMASELYGTSDVVPAPSRFALDLYGGPYSIERFRAIGTRCEVTTLSPPFVASYMVCEERELDTAKISALGINGVGSVRGLRRPAHPVPGLPQPREDAPPPSSPPPYVKFLEKRGVVVPPPAPPPGSTESAAASRASAPPPSASARSKASHSSERSTLARFLKKKE